MIVLVRCLMLCLAFAFSLLALLKEAGAVAAPVAAVRQLPAFLASRVVAQVQAYAAGKVVVR